MGDENMSSQKIIRPGFFDYDNLFVVCFCSVLTCMIVIFYIAIGKHAEEKRADDNKRYSITQKLQDESLMFFFHKQTLLRYSVSGVVKTIEVSYTNVDEEKTKIVFDDDREISLFGSIPIKVLEKDKIAVTYDGNNQIVSAEIHPAIPEVRK
jgi:hypothetical protein